MNQQAHPTAEEIETAVGLSAPARRGAVARRLLVLAILCLVAGAGYYLYQRSAAQATAVSYETAQAYKADLVINVSATGTVQPVSQVDISSEMSGVVREVLVEENENVKAGQVLATLDTDRLRAQRDQQLAVINAAEARIAEAKATLQQRQQALARQKSLKRDGVASSQSLETAAADFSRATASIQTLEAALASDKANLHIIDTDISKMQILSPVNGTVLKRSVEPGQIVAASFSAPVLFKVAEDLTRVQVEAAIDEADIARVSLGQTASFSVDAWRGRNFPAKIERLSYAPDSTDGVVTYKAVLSAANDDMALRPGMTATAVITVESYKDVLLVPNEALRYRPPEKAASQKFSITTMFMPRMPPNERRTAAVPADGTRTVYVLRDGVPVAERIKTGANNGSATQVIEGNIKAEDALVVSQRKSGAK